MTAKAQVTSLARYDAACRALAEARSVDEVKDIRDKAVAMAAYARQAKNRDLEADAVEIRMRATRRLDQLRQAQKETVGLSVGARGSRVKGARVDDKPTLAMQGIDKNLAHAARVLGVLSDEKFEQVVADARDKVARAARNAVREMRNATTKRQPNAKSTEVDQDARDTGDISRAEAERRGIDTRPPSNADVALKPSHCRPSALVGQNELIA